MGNADDRFCATLVKHILNNRDMSDAALHFITEARPFIFRERRKRARFTIVQNTSQPASDVYACGGG